MESAAAHLIGEQLAIVLGGQIWLSWLRGIQLETFANAFPEHIQCRVGFHDLGHSLDDERLDTRIPIAKRTVEIVCQVDPNHTPCAKEEFADELLW